MANPEHVAILRQGVEVWNAWRTHYPEERPDLSDTNFNGTDLRSTNFNDADLRSTTFINANLGNATFINANLSYVNLGLANLNGANFSYATLTLANLSDANLSDATLKCTNLSDAKLNNADLSDANLGNANLNGANLSDANLNGASLISADLINSNLSHANLICTNFENAKIGWGMLGNLDLRSTKGLETIGHTGPSTIGTDTILKSEGDIPEVFLRGAGLDDTFISYVLSLARKPIQYYTCFISYSSKDQDFAERLYADLQGEAPHA